MSTMDFMVMMKLIGKNDLKTSKFPIHFGSPIGLPIHSGTSQAVKAEEAKKIKDMILRRGVHA